MATPGKAGRALHHDGPHIWAEGKYLELMVAHCAENEITINEWARMADVELATLKFLISRKQRLTLYLLWRLSTALGLAPFTKFRAAKEHEAYEHKTRTGAKRKKTKAKPTAKIVEQSLRGPGVPPGISPTTGKPKKAPRGIQVTKKRQEAENMEAMIYAGTEIVPEMKVMPSTPVIVGTRPENYSSLPSTDNEEPTVADLKLESEAPKIPFEAKPEWKPMPKAEAQAQTEKAREDRGRDITGSIMDQFMSDRSNNKDRKFAR